MIEVKKMIVTSSSSLVAEAIREAIVLALTEMRIVEITLNDTIYIFDPSQICHLVSLNSKVTPFVP